MTTLRSVNKESLTFSLPAPSAELDLLLFQLVGSASSSTWDHEIPQCGVRSSIFITHVRNVVSVLWSDDLWPRRGLIEFTWTQFASGCKAQSAAAQKGEPLRHFHLHLHLSIPFLFDWATPLRLAGIGQPAMRGGTLDRIGSHPCCRL